MLRGIFEPAGYTVRIAFDAGKGLEILKTQPVHLVVTDHRLPGGITGSEFIHRFRELQINIPAIVVSGFLTDDTVRDLIRDGVEGVFIKPLNIFSLLKKANELMEKRAKASRAGAAAGPAHLGGIGQIEGLSAAGKAFVQRARDAAAFQRNLLLIGPPGTLFEEIVRDIAALSRDYPHCAALRPGEVTPARLEGVRQSHAEAGLTLVLLEAERLTADEIGLLIGLADEKGGTQRGLRMVFCLHHLVEDLYDQGKIDEEFYLFLGTNELIVPNLREMPEDLLAIVLKAIRAVDPAAHLDMRLRSLLLAHPWHDNMVELRSVIVRAVTLAQPLCPQLKHFEAALQAGMDTVAPGVADVRTPLERFLLHEKRRYQAAMDLLLNRTP